MGKLMQERIRFRLLRAVLFVSNLTSLIINVLIILFGLKFLESFGRVPDAEPRYVRIFATIECCLCTLALVAIILRHFYAFTVYTILLTAYLVCAAIFTRVPVGWFFLLGAILVTLAIIFDWMLWRNKKQLESLRQSSTPYYYN